MAQVHCRRSLLARDARKVALHGLVPPTFPISRRSARPMLPPSAPTVPSEPERRVAHHLGLTAFEFPADWNRLIGHSAHKGAAVFIFPSHRRSHIVYVPDVRWLIHHWPTALGPPAVPGSRQQCKKPPSG
jgi:hypothetical protein